MEIEEREHRQKRSWRHVRPAKRPPPLAFWLIMGINALGCLFFLWRGL